MKTFPSKKTTAFLLLLCSLMGACTKQASPDLKKSVEANESARSLVEWESSPQNPRAVFKTYREEFKSRPEIAKEVCAGLTKLKPQDLSLFEEEINNAENGALLKDCRDSLKKTLEDYWQEQKKSLQNSTLHFQFQPRIEKRDLSKGYRARTGDVNPKELIMTFDDGPHEIYTPRILDILEMVNAKVMFFHLGSNVPRLPALLQREAKAGHVIGSHSVSHRCLARNPICTKANGGTPLSFEDATSEIRGGHQAIYDVLGFVDPFFRFPYGESDAELTQFLADRQVGQFYWNIDSGDWRAQPLRDLLANTLGQIDKAQRGIVLFHDTQRRTLEILPEFLKALWERGFNLVVLQSLDEQARDNSQLVTKRPPLP